ncbi:MAG: hypothetical protein ACYSTT_02810 [Planctomycetota bacterium]|jgi:hypothetical protein
MAIPVWLIAVDEKENFRLTQIPLKLSGKSDSHEQGWKVIRFQNKPPNKVISDEDGLRIGVESSANLLAYCLNGPVDVNSVLLQGLVTGFPRIPEDKRQGDKKADDFALRFGLVISGTKKLGKIERCFAPELIKRLCELVPKSQGIDHVLFLNLANNPPPKWRKRTHPVGKGLLQEQICSIKNEPGDFRIKVTFQKPYNVLALCIICDGDDTKSKYQVTINKIQLNPKREKMH